MPEVAWLLGATAVVVLVGFQLGALTSFGQTYLPPSLYWASNSFGSWALAAFVLAMLARRAWQGAFLGSLTLVMLELGYTVTANLRGHPSSTTTTAFWLLTGLLGGPILGLAGHWAARRRGDLAALGTGVMTGVLIGEAARKLHDLVWTGDPGSTGYWWAQGLLGAALLLGLGSTRFRSVQGAVVALAAVGATVLVFSHFVTADLVARF